MNISPILENKIIIQLGDIIQITAPTDPDLHNKIFFVNYVDVDKIKLLNGEDEKILRFNEEHNLSNESITDIDILSRAISPSYAIQHNLNIGTWIDIYFGGDIPTIITGKITNLEEDMIEIKTFPDQDMIYIDFEYKGIPEDIPIERIQIRSAPSQSSPQSSQLREEGKEIEVLAEGQFLIPPSEQALISMSEQTDKELLEDETYTEEFAPVISREQIREIVINADQIRFGEKLGVITMSEDVSESEQRFSIEKQTTDLLDELLSTIPNIQRTNSVLNNIHKMIERFKQLRTTFSTFDSQGNALMPLVKGAKFKPLVDTLYNFNQKLYWILPVSTIKKKVYDVDEYDETDIDFLTLEQSKIDEDEIIKTYLENDVPIEDNKYAYLLKSLNPFFTPFTDPAYKEYKIATKNVNTNITAIIDNLSDFYSSVVKNDSIKRRRFVIQEYNLGLTRLETTKVKGGDTIINRKQVTQNDTITLKSLVTLPEESVRFSRINLPSTDIMIKSNLNMHFLNYWELLRNKTNVQTTIVDKIDEPVNYETIKFLKTCREYILDETIQDENQYRNFLEAVVPTTRTLFKLVSPYMNGKLSVHEVLNYLEPFMIYQQDLTFMQYQEINEFIKNKINEYKRTYTSRSRYFNSLNLSNDKNKNKTQVKKQSKTQKETAGIQKLSLSKLFENNEIILEKLLEKYDITDPTISDSELLVRINKVDNGILYNSTISFLNITLMIANGMENIDSIDKIVKDTDMAVSTDPSICPKYKVIAKKYLELDELEEDNDVEEEIYFDKIYDTTFYDIGKEFKTDPDVSLIDREKMLVEHLVKKSGVKADIALRDAKAMIKGRRIVENGDYAILESRNDNEISMKYYERLDGKWVLDTSISSDVFAYKPKLLCNLNENCIEVKGKCNELKIGSDAMQKPNMQQIIKEFDSNLMANKELVENLIRYNMGNASERIDKIANINHNKTYIYDKQKYLIGLTSEDREIIVSPYEKLRELILGQADFAKKQLDIAKFVALNTREANEASNESEFWLYCPITNIKLLPLFISTLADTFINKEDYKNAINKICKEQGTISDDGDTWVDKHSGYFICTIDLSSEDEYNEEGFKITSSSVMDVDIGDVIMQQKKVQIKVQEQVIKKKFESPEAEAVSNVIMAMSGFMNINVDKKKEFILRNVLKQQETTMPTKDVYNKAIIAAAARGKKNLDSYEVAFNQSLILLTLSYFLVAIQTSIPNIKTKKTHPGCIRSFSGFPLNEGVIEDNSGLKYVACVANKIKSSAVPWNGIQRLNQDSLVKSMEASITKFLLKNEEVQDSLKEKRLYLLNYVEEIIPPEHNIKKWTNFLPQLRPFKLATLQNVSDAFEQSFLDSLRKGSDAQHSMIAVFRSKIIYYALGIQASIQKSVQNKTAILVNSSSEPFIENSCCDNADINSLAYFISEQPEIKVYNQTIKHIGDILTDVMRMRKAAILFDPTNNKRILTKVSTEFSEDTIYRAFIVFCKYNSDIPLKEELKLICINKPERIIESSSIEETIKKLKNDGHNYSIEALQKLLLIVNRSNMVELNMNTEVVDKVQILRDILTSMDERNVMNIPRAFRDKMMAMIKDFEINGIMQDTTEMRSFKNYLAIANEGMLNVINDFISRFANIKTSEINKIKECIKTISDFQKIGNENFIEKDDETIYRMVNFIKNSIVFITREMPNIIINNVDYSHVKIPLHWKLSDLHNNDLIKSIKKHYLPLYSYYNDEEVKLILNKFLILTRDTELLASNTEFYAPIKMGDKYVYSVFDRRCITSLFTFYFYSILTDLISLKDNDDILLQNISRPLSSDSDKELIKVNTLEFETMTTKRANEFQTGSISEIEIIKGEKEGVTKKIANIIVSAMTIICSDKAVINYNYDSLIELVTRTKEDEKDSITTYLKEMTDEEREVENLFKNNKLERWSKGLQKGFVTYQPDTYDEERENMEARALNELKMGKKGIVTDLHRNIYEMGFLEQEAEGARIEKEEMAIYFPRSNDDDDVGEGDGDDY
jgi:hypothetical protein